MADQAHAASAARLRDVHWERSYLGLLETVKSARRDARAILGSCPQSVAEDVEFVASELAANAIRHSRSGTTAGGTYVVRVSHYATEKAPYVWIEVEDEGSPSWDGVLRPQPMHGLAMIGCLATSMGSDHGADGHRAVYARLEYRVDGTSVPGAAPVPELPPTLDGIRV